MTAFNFFSSFMQFEQKKRTKVAVFKNQSVSFSFSTVIFVFKNDAFSVSLTELCPALPRYIEIIQGILGCLEIKVYHSRHNLIQRDPGILNWIHRDECYTSIHGVQCIPGFTGFKVYLDTNRSMI